MKKNRNLLKLVSLQPVQSFLGLEDLWRPQGCPRPEILHNLKGANEHKSLIYSSEAFIELELHSMIETVPILMTVQDNNWAGVQIFNHTTGAHKINIER